MVRLAWWLACLIAIASVPDLATAREGFDALSGEIHATLKGVLLDESRYPRDAVLTRLSEPTGGSSLWVQGLGGKGAADGDGNAASLDRSSVGALFGVDAGLGGGLRAGLAAGYHRSRIKVDPRGSRANVGSVHVGAYAGGRWGGTSLKAGVIHSWHDIETKRDSAFTGRLSADYKARQLQLFVETGHRISMGKGGIEPFAGLAWSRLRTERFRERGGPAALHARGQGETAAWSTLGLRVIRAQ